MHTAGLLKDAGTVHPVMDGTRNNGCAMSAIARKGILESAKKQQN